MMTKTLYDIVLKKIDWLEQNKASPKQRSKYPYRFKFDDDFARAIAKSFKERHVSSKIDLFVYPEGSSDLYYWNGLFYKVFGSEFEEVVRSMFSRKIIKEKCTKNKLAEVYAALRNEFSVSHLYFYDQDEHTIVFKNGYFDVDIMSFKKPDSSLRMRTHFDINYIPNGHSENFSRYLENLVPEEGKRDLLLIWLSYCFLPTVKYQKAVLLYGAQDAGKSLLQDLMSYIFKDYDASKTLQEIGHDRFIYAVFENKLINCGKDLPVERMKDHKAFNNLVSDYQIDARIMHSQTPLRYKNTSHHLFTCNDIPLPPSNAGKDFYRRWILIYCPNSINEEDINENLLDEFKDEIEQIISFILSYSSRLPELKSRFTNENRLEWLKYGESPFRWYAQCRLSPEIEWSFRDAYENYKHFCMIEQLPIVSPNKFSRDMHEVGIQKTRDWEGSTVLVGIGSNN